MDLDPLLNLLAVAGVLAVLGRLGRALAGAALRSAEVLIPRETGEVRARRGDLTGLDEARVLHDRARATRRRSALRALGWLAALIVPMLTPWTRLIYIGFAALWVLPRRPHTGGIIVRRERG